MFTPAGAAQARILLDNLVAVYQKHFGGLPVTQEAVAAVVRADLVGATHKALTAMRVVDDGAATGGAPASASSGATSATAAKPDRPFPGEAPQAATVKFMEMLPDQRINSQKGLLLLIGAIAAQLNPDSTSKDRDLLADKAAEVLCMPRRRTFQVVDEITADAALCLAAAAREFNMGWVDTGTLPGPLRMAASLGAGKITSLVQALAPLYSARGHLMHTALRQTEGCMQPAQGALLAAKTPTVAASVILGLPAWTFPDHELLDVATRPSESDKLPTPLAGSVTDIDPFLRVLLNNPDRFDRAFIASVRDQLVAANTEAAGARANFARSVDGMITAGLSELTTYGSAWTLTRNRAKQALALAVGTSFTAEVAKLMAREAVPDGTPPADMASLRLAAWVKCLQRVSAEHDALVESAGITSGDFGAMLTRLITEALTLATTNEYGSVACIVHPTFSLAAMIEKINEHLASLVTDADAATTTATSPRTERDGSADTDLSTARAADEDGAPAGGAVATVVYSGAGGPPMAPTADASP